MAEVLKSGKNITPKVYENLTFLSATISNGITLANKSTPSQYLTLLNRLWVAFDSAIDGFEDIVKLDMDGDSYTIVSGIQSEGKSSKAVAANVVAFGLALVAAAHEVDMSDQIVDSVTIKIGIHSGSAVGGISNPAFPKLSFLGDAPAIAKLMEETSRAGGVHVSGHTQELVKDKYTCDVSESINFKTQRVSSFWVADESSKKRGASRGGNAQ
jgi:class 3 adenylate cyclase